MRLFSWSTEIEIQDLRIGRVRITVRENVLDRIIGWFDPARAQRRLQVRAALQEGSTPGPPRRGVISAGVPPPKKEYFGHW